MDIPQASRKALQLLIQGMCKSCRLKDCELCIYLEQAFDGDTEQIVTYIAVHNRETAV